MCQCAPPKPGEVGCGDDCLNRMLNVECLPQMCPCGSLCTNQQVIICVLNDRFVIASDFTTYEL